MVLDTSKFLGGNGTSTNPYIIHNADALLALIGDAHSDGSATYKYFELVSDIDLTYLGSLQGKYTNITWSCIYGNGHTITFPPLASSKTMLTGGGSQIYNLNTVLNGTDGTGVNTRGPYTRSTLTNCMFSGAFADIYLGNFDIGAHALINCLFNVNGSPNRRLSTTTVSSSTTSYYIEGSAPITDDLSDGLVLTVNSLNAASYPNLSDEHWDKIDGSLPQLKIKPYGGQPVTRVAGYTKIDGVPVKRRVTVQDSNGGKVAQGYSDETTGAFDLQTSPHKAGLVVIVDDVIGNELVASKAYNLGDTVHPADYAGIAYVCTTAGTTAATLPTSYPDSGTITIGSAVFTAKPIHKPQIAAPVKPQVVLE